MNSLFAIIAPVILVLFATFMTACGKKDEGSATTIQPVRSQKPVQPQQPIKPGPNGPQKPGTDVPAQRDPNQPPVNDAQKCENGDEAACDNVDTPVTDNQDQQQLPPQISEEEIASLATQYTSAGGDGFRSHLAELMNQKMKLASNKVRYYMTAKSIRSIRAEVNGESMNVRVERAGQDGTQYILLKGNLGFDSGVARLRKIKTVRAGQNSAGQISAAFTAAAIDGELPAPVLPNGSPGVAATPSPGQQQGQAGQPPANDQRAQQDQSGQPPVNPDQEEDSTEISGSAMCLDKNKEKCLVVLVNLKIGSQKTPVLAVVRRTGASISLIDQNIPNANANNLFGYFANTERQILKSMKSVEFTSSEVVHGRTEMKALIIMNDNQMIAAQGAMLAPVETKFTNVQWEKATDLRDLMGRDPRTGFRQDLQNMITAVRMTTNNGKGEVTLAFGTPADALGGGAGEVSIIFTRNHPLVKYVDEIRADGKKYRLNLDL